MIGRIVCNGGNGVGNGGGGFGGSVNVFFIIGLYYSNFVIFRGK